MSAANSTSQQQSLHFQLFVAGSEPNSRRARDNLARVCAGPLNGRCTVEIWDVFDDFERALAHGILVAPTLIVTGPGQPITLIGDLGDEVKLTEALGVNGQARGRSHG